MAATATAQTNVVLDLNIVFLPPVLSNVDAGRAGVDSLQVRRRTARKSFRLAADC
jgi:hypothetical protein